MALQDLPDSENKKLVIENLLDASCEGNIEAVKKLIQDGVNPNRGVETPLMMASLKNQESIVRYLCDLENINLDKKSTSGQTALFFAAQGGNIEIMEMLLSKGSQVNKTDYVGNTVLHEAFSSDIPEKYFKVAKKLIKWGIDICHCNTMRQFLFCSLPCF